MKPLLIAHRGDTINFKGNTLKAFGSALAKGADGIELDVQLDKQGRLIVEHDYIYKEIIKPLLLETVLEKFSHKGFIEIEIKGFEADLVKKVVSLIKKFKLSQYSITSSVLPILPYVRKALPQAHLGAILKPYLFATWMNSELTKRLTVGYLKLTQANAAHLYPGQYQKYLISFLKKQGFLTHGHIYTDEVREFKKIRELGIERCTIDNINLLKNLNLKKYNN